MLFSLSLQKDTKLITPYHELTMEFKQENDRIYFTLRNINSKNGWVSYGFGGDSMVKTDYHSFTFKVDGSFNRAEDLWSTDQDFPAPDTALSGGKNDIMDLKSFKEGSDGVITYWRYLDTNDKYDNVINSNGKTHFELAWFEEELDISKHASQIRFGSINVNSSKKEISFTVTHHPVLEVHGLVLLFSWSILNSIGYICGRLFRHFPIARWIHLFTSGLTAILTIIFAFVGLSQGNFLLFRN